VLKTETFDELYRRALHQCPELHQNIRMLVYRCGPEKHEVYLSKHRVYEDKEEAKNGEANRDPLAKRTFRLGEPDAEICLVGDVYRFKLTQSPH
jgi:hypothetical protein